MRTLLVDNHDSYTYNVFHLLAGVSGEEPIVVDNDAVSWRALERWNFDAIVLSPGPGTPGRWHDFCVCDDILRFSEIPVLGICLGHQGLGHLLDGQVSSAPEAMHGRLSTIVHDGDGLFDGIPQGFPVVRYHSLAITGMGPDGNVCAWADDGVVMGIEHRQRPMWGVQFHPESIATEHGATPGRELLRPRPQRTAPVRRRAPGGARRATRPWRKPGLATTRSCSRARSPARPRPRRYSNALFAAEEHAFWLDSADAPTRLAQSSYLGTSAGRDRCVLEYDVDEGAVRSTGADGTRDRARLDLRRARPRGRRRAIERPGEACPRTCSAASSATSATSSRRIAARTNVHSSDVPDAVMMLANRLVAVDHVARTHPRAGRLRRRRGREAERLAGRGRGPARDLSPTRRAGPRRRPGLRRAQRSPRRFDCGRGREQYLADIDRWQAELAAGESYEVCLTDQISTDASPTRSTSTAACAAATRRRSRAFLKLGDVAVVSSSPERFLRGRPRRRRVEARPIKGTAAARRDAGRGRGAGGRADRATRRTAPRT